MRRKRRGTAMIEMGLCLALFTPLVFASVRLAYGASQMHSLADGLAEAARAGGACASEEEIRRVATGGLPGVRPADVEITIDRESDPALIRVAIRNVRIVTLTGAEPLAQPASAAFPYLCD